MRLVDPSRLPLSSLASGIGLSAISLAAWNFLTWMIPDGFAPAINVDGGGGSTLGILILVGGFGFIFGLPVAAAAPGMAPRSWLMTLLAMSTFCASGAVLTASPAGTAKGYIEGGLLSLAFATLSIASGVLLQWAGTTLSRRTRR